MRSRSREFQGISGNFLNPRRLRWFCNLAPASPVGEAIPSLTPLAAGNTEVGNPTARISLANCAIAPTSLPSRRNCCQTLRTPIELESCRRRTRRTKTMSRRARVHSSPAPATSSVPAHPRRTGGKSPIACALSHPAARRLRHAADLRRYRANRGAFRGVLNPPMLLNPRTARDRHLG